MSTAYVPLQPPYQIIKYRQDVAMQIGTLIVTVQKGDSHYQIETHSHPVVSYDNKNREGMTDNQLTEHHFLEGAVWNNVEVKDVTTVCLTDATLTWMDFLDILEHECLLTAFTAKPDIDLYWDLRKLGVKVLPPKEREYAVLLSVMVQPEEAGLSLQSSISDQLFLNVSVAEDEEDKEHVFYNKEENKWNSDAWKDEEKVWNELNQQLSEYKLIFRDLLFDAGNGRFIVTYKTDEPRFRKIVERLNHDKSSVNLGFPV